MDIQKSLKEGIKRFHWQNIVRPAARRALPDWQTIINRDPSMWADAREAAISGPKILIATNTGGHHAATPIESLLAVALTLRGANVHFMLCDKSLPACLQAQYLEFWNYKTFAKEGPKSLCNECFGAGYALYKTLSLPIHLQSTLVEVEERKYAAEVARSLILADIKDYKFEGLKVGEHALAGALRFFARGTLSGEAQGEVVLRRYLEASLLTVYATRRLAQEHHFESACFHHGIYVPHGLIGEVARQCNVRVSNWHPAYRKRCFIFSHNDTYHHTLMSEPTDVWDQIEWTPKLEETIQKYLKSRWQGTQDWIKFHQNPTENLKAIAQELGVDFSKPCIGMLTNVVWDAQLHYPANAFPDMIDWVIRTIAYFVKRPELQLIIRVHPAEIRGTLPSRQPIVDEINKVFPQLPSNVFLIPPESQISTYAVMTQCNSVIIYGTKTGVELSSLSMPVIVAGEAWIRNKGVTLDARSDSEYFDLLDALPLEHRLDERTTRRALSYAYHFFFRRMIPLNCVSQIKHWPSYQIKVNSLTDLLPGKDRGLDIICNGILTGSSFVYPAEDSL